MKCIEQKSAGKGPRNLQDFLDDDDDVPDGVILTINATGDTCGSGPAPDQGGGVI